MRFCSRCGLQLGAVTAFLAGGDAPPETAMFVSGHSQTRKARRQGAKLMFLSGVLVPVAIFLSLIFDSPFPVFLPVTVFLAGLAWFLYYRLFGEDVPTLNSAHAPAHVAAPRQSFLHSAQSVPVTDLHATAPRTAEIVQPPSVTEHTTKLLDDQ